MGREYWLELDDAETYRVLRPEIARWIRARSSCALEVDPSDFLLKDPSTASAWDHDVRVLLEPERICLLVSVVGVVFRRDVRALHAWLAAHARVAMFDADGDPVDPLAVFGTPADRCVRELAVFARAWRADPRVDPEAEGAHLSLGGDSR